MSVPRRSCISCGCYLREFPKKAPEFMILYFEYCPGCKTVYYTGEDL